jgi:hypothetical protein
VVDLKPDQLILLHRNIEAAHRLRKFRAS